MRYEPKFFGSSVLTFVRGCRRSTRSGRSVVRHVNVFARAEMTFKVTAVALIKRIKTLSAPHLHSWYVDDCGGNCIHRSDDIHEHGFMRGRRPVWRRAARRGVWTMMEKSPQASIGLPACCLTVKLTGRQRRSRGPLNLDGRMKQGSGRSSREAHFNSQTGTVTGMESGPPGAIRPQKLLDL